MIKVLYFDWFQSATEFYRSSGVFPYINIDNISITRSTEHNISFATMAGYDVVYLERPTSIQSLNIIRMAKDMHIKVIVDYDDDILHVPNSNPMYETYQEQMSYSIQCLVLADEIWVTTKGLKKAFSLYNKNIHVIPNAHNDYVFKVEDKKKFNSNSKTALWRGGDSHYGDMYDIGVPEMIIDVVNTNKDWTFKFFGQRFHYLEKRCGDNYIALSGASTIQFYKLIHEENPAIVFYPLEDNLFNRSKSNILWLEATYSGAAVFGNISLPEYESGDVTNVRELGLMISEFDEYKRRLERNNISSWHHIQANLLLSNINKLREERLLSL